MKKPVLQRKMFADGGSVKESKGILSGFDNEMENEDYDERTPDNIEIIANNLRGDIRSMDERYLELASLVGEAAFDTPEEVVALMQSQMGQQTIEPIFPQAANLSGIASLGVVPEEAPQEGGITQGFEEPAPQEGQMPPEAQQPGMEQPVQMAHGGVVHRAMGSLPMGEVAQNARAFGSFGNPVPPSPYDPRLYGLPAVGGNMPILSREALQYLQGGAGGFSSFPQQIPATLRASTAVSEGMRNLVPNVREASRIMMSTPQGRAATALGLTGAATIPFLTGGEQPSEGGPVYSEVPGVDASGRYTPVLRDISNMPGTEEQKAAVRNTGWLPNEYLGVGDIGGVGPTPEEVVGMSGAATTAPEPSTAARAEAVKTAVAPEAAAKPKTMQERVKDRLNIYKEFLGEDENMRQAQALFLLAEAALNVGTAPGRTTAERILKGTKGLPAGLAAIAAEKTKQDTALKSAAISAVESEMAAESKQGTQIMLKLAELQAKNADVNEIANYLMGAHGFNKDKAVQVARLSKSGALKVNDAGETVDPLGKVIISPYKLVEGDVGYLPADGSVPFVSVGKRSLVPATSKDRPALATEMANNQAMAASIERVMQLPSFESGLGPIARIQSGVTTVLTPFLGSNVPFTDLAKDVQMNIAMDLRNELIQLNARNTSRPSVWEQKQVEKFIGDPKAILTSPDEFFGVLNNFRVKAINRANEIEHQLTGAPLKQLEHIPMGTAKDPLQSRDAGYLGEFFRLRPNASIYIQLPNERSPRKFTAQEWFKQTGAQ